MTLKYGYGILLVAPILAVGVACSSTADSPSTPPPPQADAGGDGASASSCPAKDLAATRAATGTTHESLANDETWKAEDSPHRITADFEINNNHTLTIEPCAVVVLDEDAHIQVGLGQPTPQDGALVANGTADKPIAFIGSKDAAASWDGITFARSLGKARLSYVTLDGAGRARGARGVDIHAAVQIENQTTDVTIDHSTLSRGGMYGIFVESGSAIGPASEGNTITGMGDVPIRTAFTGIGTVLDGKYSGNKVDRVEIYDDVSPSAPATWHKLPVPWHFRDFGVQLKTALTIEPGTHVIVESTAKLAPAPEMLFEGNIVVAEGGSITADGQSAAGLIVFEGEADDAPGSWQGLQFTDKAGASKLSFVKLVKAGGMLEAHSSLGHCEDPSLSAGWHSAIHVAKDGVLTMTNTELRDVGENNYAVDRDYCHAAEDQYASSAQNNKFAGAMLCGETDTNPCSPPVCALGTCCDHEYTCYATPTQ